MNKSYLDEIKKTVENVEGNLTVSEGEFLFNTSKKCKGSIIEIGSWKGKSTIWLGKGSKLGNNVNIYAIDPHTGSIEQKERYGKLWTFDEFKENIHSANVDDIVIPIVKTSEEARKEWNSSDIEFLWIDGDHEYEFVKLDFEIWSPHLIEGGIIAFHDTTGKEGPKKVVDKYIYKSKNYRSIGFIDSITFAQKVNNNSFLDRIRNRYVLFIKNIYTYTRRLLIIRPLRKIGKKIINLIQ